MLKYSEDAVLGVFLLPTHMNSTWLTFFNNLIHIKLTLVISRDHKFSMWNIFRVKTKIQEQVEEYVKFKAKSSPYIAKDQEQVLNAFIKEVGYLTVTEIPAEDIEKYHNKISSEMTNYFTIQSMKAIRAFMRFHKHDTNIIADKITNHGIRDLQDVGRNIPVVPDTRPKLGRPMNIELVKKVKRLRDIENLSFRSIGKALSKDVKNVYLMYKYDVPCSIVGKKRKSG